MPKSKTSVFPADKNVLAVWGSLEILTNYWEKENENSKQCHIIEYIEALGHQFKKC